MTQIIKTRWEQVCIIRLNAAFHGDNYVYCAYFNVDQFTTDQPLFAYWVNFIRSLAPAWYVPLVNTVRSSKWAFWGVEMGPTFVVGIDATCSRPGVGVRWPHLTSLLAVFSHRSSLDLFRSIKFANEACDSRWCRQRAGAGCTPRGGRVNHGPRRRLHTTGSQGQPWTRYRLHYRARETTHGPSRN